MNSEAINRVFTNVFNCIRETYNAVDEEAEDCELTIDQCIARARALLDQPAIPRFHRIKTLLLLVRMVEDTEAAWECLREADITLRLVQAQAARGQPGDPDVAETILALRASIEGVRGILEDEDAAKEQFEAGK
jgi:hypothetical protein